jgi:deferrochelatase/peroxidase EfeB
MTSSRRLFLGAAGGLAGGIAGAMATGAAARAQIAPARAQPDPADAEPFYGKYQGGIITPMQEATYFAVFDIITTSRQDLISLLKSWTAAAARLAAGLPAEPGAQDDNLPPLDSGEVVGMRPSRLTLTFGFGPELFAAGGKDRFGLAHLRPAPLVDLPHFNGDQLEPGQCGGALSIQACANDTQVAFHAVRQLARIGAPAVQLRWVQSGFTNSGKAQGTPRNLLGFKDGTMNPTIAAAPPIIWADAAPAPWMENGSYMVTRRVRIFLEHWDRMRVAFQEQTIGRHKASGAAIGAKSEFDPPDFNGTDADGNSIIPDNAHIRLAAPVNNGGSQMLRRSYSYNNGASFVAERWPPWHQGIEYDSGLFFQAYQKDPRDAFIKIFDKMSKLDALNQFTTHVGSAIFACPPGVQQGGYIGQTLFEAA